MPENQSSIIIQTSLTEIVHFVLVTENGKCVLYLQNTVKFLLGKCVAEEVQNLQSEKAFLMCK